MTPSIGRTVIVRGRLVESNGAKEAPAVITRVWMGRDIAGAPFVNLTVFPDNAPPIFVSSVHVFETAHEAENQGYQLFAYWPPRS